MTPSTMPPSTATPPTMTPTTLEIARRRAALRRIGHSIAMGGGAIPVDLRTVADEYARGIIGENELVGRVRHRFGLDG